MLSLVLWANFDPTTADFQFLESSVWLGGNITYKMGVDGISMLFVVLTAFLMPISILASEAIHTRLREYLVAFLLLETLMIGVFCALDLVVFYVFFEGGLIPMFLIIGVWGGARRVYATFKFFLYTLLGSVLMLLAILAIYVQAGTTDIVALLRGHVPFPGRDAALAVAGVLRLLRRQAADVAGAHLASRRPCRSAHRGLGDPCRHPLEDGRLRLPALLAADVPAGQRRICARSFSRLSLIAIIYTSLVALAQEDMKKLIAYSSVAHMGLVTLGTFTFSIQGIDGAIFQMLSHGIVSGALFLCVGVIYDRMHTREIAAYGGLVNRMPAYAACFMVFTLANVGLPGTSGFVGEFLTLLAAFRYNTWIAIVGTTGIVLSAAYALWLYRRVIFGAAGEGQPSDDRGSRSSRGRLPGGAGSRDDLLRRLSQAGLRRDARLDRASRPVAPAGRGRRPRGSVQP